MPEVTQNGETLEPPSSRMLLGYAVETPETPTFVAGGGRYSRPTLAKLKGPTGTKAPFHI